MIILRYFELSKIFVEFRNFPGFLEIFADFSANRAIFAGNFTEFCRNCGKLEREIFPFPQGKGKTESMGKRENEIKFPEKGNGRAPNLN